MTITDPLSISMFFNQHIYPTVSNTFCEDVPSIQEWIIYIVVVGAWAEIDLEQKFSSRLLIHRYGSWADEDLEQKISPGIVNPQMWTLNGFQINS